MRAWLATLALAGCAATGGGGGGASGGDATRLALDAGGIQPAGTALRIDFGRAQTGTVAAVSRLLGTPPVESVRNGDCGAGPVTAVRWANGLTLNFQDGAFLGWVSAEGDGDPVGTAAGLRPGTPRAGVEAVPGARFATTTLGAEFEAQGVSGLLEGPEVGMLWAGVTCFFR